MHLLSPEANEEMDPAVLRGSKSHRKVNSKKHGGRTAKMNGNNLLKVARREIR